jgi:glycogen debranching enzyme
MDDLASPGPQVEQGETTEPRVPHRLFALKDGDTFVVADAYGDILGVADGLFHDDTRVLSHFRLLLGNRPPSLLSAAIAQDNVFFTSNGTNRPLAPTGAAATPKGVIHIERKRFLWDGRLHERIRCTNYSRDQAAAPLAFEFGADFHDMFEVRGTKRARRGRIHEPEASGRQVVFRYDGLDDITRASVIVFSEQPVRLSGNRAEFLFHIPPDGVVEFYLEVGKASDAPAMQTPSRERFRACAARARFAIRAKRRHGARIKTSGRLFDEWVEKSRSDLSLLITDLETGPYPYAGIPWFSTPFGRDAIITAWQVLWINASLARGVLAYLASTQATETSTFRDSQPGKIMHESRRGEMTNLGELPFGRYYGGVDTTPLFVALAGAYADRTGDLEFIDRLWPSLTAAVDWMEQYGDSNDDGLIDYQRGQDSGLANQGWKDSQDSVFHADGSFPDGPIALIEVQGYAFAAYRAMAGLAERREDPAAAIRWLARAEKIRRIVEERFWMEEHGTYGIAIDGHGQLCRVPASNPGHLLFCGLPAPDRARRVTECLLSAPFQSGWGIRTLGTGQARFNPMSYHNGSVWPHDTALCVAGMARYGERAGVVQMLSEMFETAVSFEMRLPELFCGFKRNPGEPPVAYPVACLPQAWAAGSIFMLLQACLGVKIDGWTSEISIDHPCLPIGIDKLSIDSLRVGSREAQLLFQHAGDRVIAVPGRRCDPKVAVLTRA